MKKLLFFVSSIVVAGCSSYTVKNELAVKIKAGDREVGPGECAEFSDSFFGLFGDFPALITKEDGTALSEEAPADKEWDANNYVVSANGAVNESEDPCEVAEPAETEGEGEDSEGEDGDEPDKAAAPPQKSLLEQKLGSNAPAAPPAAEEAQPADGATQPEAPAPAEGAAQSAAEETQPEGGGESGSSN